MPEKINILLQGFCSGLVRKLKESELLGNIYILEKDYFIAEDLGCICLGDHKTTKISELKNLIKEKNIHFIVIFSQAYLYKGFTDFFRYNKIPVIGVTKKWFELESSKIRGKKFMENNNIITPEYKIIKDIKDLPDIIKTFGFPLVLKNNDLCAGFGAYICENEKECRLALKKIFKKSSLCIAERFIKGRELSQQYLWDGNKLIPFLPVRDYKKLKEHDRGINTGGLGSYVPIELNDIENQLLNEYNRKLNIIFKQNSPDFTGVFTADLLFGEDRVYTLEFNMRPCITEFETLIEHMDCDLLKLLYKCALGQADEKEIAYKNGITACVALAHKNYPKQKRKIFNIKLERYISLADNDVKLNIKARSINEEKLEISAKRIFMTVLCTDKINPFKKIYKYLETFDSKNIYFRKDIGE